MNKYTGKASTAAEQRYLWQSIEIECRGSRHSQTPVWQVFALWDTIAQRCRRDDVTADDAPALTSQWADEMTREESRSSGPDYVTASTLFGSIYIVVAIYF
jgi:hypothetical protein